MSETEDRTYALACTYARLKRSDGVKLGFCGAGCFFFLQNYLIIDEKNLFFGMCFLNRVNLPCTMVC